MFTRQPAVAGSFYPQSAIELKKMVHGFLQQANASEPGHGSGYAPSSAPKAIIAPHAGYIYSGAVAASAYAHLIPLRDQIRRVVLLGPAHRVAFRGLAVSSANYFATPLGNVELDHEAIAQISGLVDQSSLTGQALVQILDEAHAQEHSLEVHLPFLQEVLGDFRLVPIVVGDATADQVDSVLELLWGGEETLIVISSDLSHYHDYQTAQVMDARTSKAIETLHPDQIHYDDACGRNPVSGLLVAARKHGLQAQTIDLRNSGDTAGPLDRVVGYGAYVFS